MVGPDYVRPEAPEQKAFQAARGASALEPGEVQWWRNLNDPQLVKYIERGLAENQTIKEAQAHVREARALRGVAAASLMPRVGAGAQYTPSRLSGTAGIVGQFPPGFITLQQDFYEVGFDASWEIDVFGGTRREAGEHRELPRRLDFRGRGNRSQLRGAAWRPAPVGYSRKKQRPPGTNAIAC
jgi:outer membrane protein TolC